MTFGNRRVPAALGVLGLAAAALGAAAFAAPAAGGSVSFATTYVVAPRDTLSEIAATHGTTVNALAAANAIADPNVILVGQLLRIPSGVSGLPLYTVGARDVDRYAVRPGDGVLRIARRFGVDPGLVARSNGVTINAILQRGAILHIPGRLARVDALLTETAAAVGVDSSLVRAVAWNESSWNQSAISPTGAVGIMQVEPYTGEWIAKYLAGRPLDLGVAGDNVLAGTLLLHHLATIHGGDIPAALADYYQGAASITRHGIYPDTLRYQRRVAHLLSQG